MNAYLPVLGVPGAIRISSYLFLALYHKKWNLLGVKTHDIFIFPASFFNVTSVRAIALIFLLFVALSVLFRTGMKAVTDKRWLMHGRREIVTFFLTAAGTGASSGLISGRSNSITPILG